MLRGDRGSIPRLPISDLPLCFGGAFPKRCRAGKGFHPDLRPGGLARVLPARGAGGERGRPYDDRRQYPEARQQKAGNESNRAHDAPQA